MLRLLHGTRSTPVSVLRLGAGIFVSEDDASIHQVSTTPTEYGGQDGAANAIEQVTDVLTLIGGADEVSRFEAFPSGVTDVDSSLRFRKDTTGFDAVRLFASVVTGSAGGGRLGIEYSTDGGSSWDALADLDPKISLGTAGRLVTSWRTLKAGAIGNILLRLTTSDGDGVVSAEVETVTAEFRARGAYEVVSGLLFDDFDYIDTAAMLGVWTQHRGGADSWAGLTIEQGTGAVEITVPNLTPMWDNYYIARTFTGLVPGSTVSVVVEIAGTILDGDYYQVGLIAQSPGQAGGQDMLTRVDGGPFTLTVPGLIVNPAGEMFVQIGFYYGAAGAFHDPRTIVIDSAGVF